MKKIGKLAAACTLALSAAIMLGACGHGHLAGHAASIRASASALATSPAVVAAEKAAIREVQACAKSAEGVTVTIPAPGAGGSPAVSGVSPRIIRHPLVALETIARCTPAGKANGAALRACAQRVITANGIGHNMIARDIADLATRCVAATP